jgi:ribonuclease HII
MMRPTLNEEIRCWRAGLRRVAGVDEAGRGPLAGPVVAAAVVLDPSEVASWWVEVRDSKLLGARLRGQLAERIRADGDVGVGVGIVGHDAIDARGIVPATLEAMRLAVSGLREAPHFVLVDGRALPDLDTGRRAIVRGDALCLSIGAASIVAKVERDRIMCEYDSRFPGYGFARHKGYATPEHLAALAERGACAIHRRSFAPVRTSGVDAQPDSSGERTGVKKLHLLTEALVL